MSEFVKLEHFERFQTDLQQVFGMLKYRSRKEELLEYIDRNREYFEHVDGETYQAMLENGLSSTDIKRYTGVTDQEILLAKDRQGAR